MENMQIYSLYFSSRIVLYFSINMLHIFLVAVKVYSATLLALIDFKTKTDFEIIQRNARISNCIFEVKGALPTSQHREREVKI